VVLHAAGSYVPLPPTPLRHGVGHWRVRPEVCGWHMPESSTVQDALIDALTAEVTHTRPAGLVVAD
jgi:hypothetical protein